ncbi:ABC transporter permease [Streptomyces sp. ISL-100]|uniref:ABC transporter permease n=1 Tax=Streptomyces sp. ISL-100 TaxID=2819173 RepID=UPI001BEB3FA5|nr:ABC transporter permease [Streptomyces sp. ISL-100]MBT2400073.1 ABC transporter permease [Streptomyces sp. ISL-100]
MTAPTTEQSLTAPVTEPRARFGDLVAAEWLKLWSLRSTPWALLISALAVIAFNVFTAYDHYRYWYEYDALARAEFVSRGIATADAFTGNAATALLLAAGSIGAVSITSEYSTGLIRTTFAAVPARRSVLAAKVVVMAVVMTVFGAVVAAASFGLTQAILSGRDAAASIGSPGALRVVVASTLLAPVAALVGLALGAVIRHSAGAVMGSFAILLVVPTALSDDRYLPAVIDHVLPYSAWMRLSDLAYDPNVGHPYPWTVAGAWVVLAAWALVAAVLAVTTVHRRDQ